MDKTSNEIQLSFHINNIPCSEEYYMGASVSSDAFIVSVPEANIPERLLNIIKSEHPNQRIINIAIVR